MDANAALYSTSHCMIHIFNTLVFHHKKIVTICKHKVQYKKPLKLMSQNNKICPSVLKDMPRGKLYGNVGQKQLGTPLIYKML